jgi:hypothetical protein
MDALGATSIVTDDLYNSNLDDVDLSVYHVLTISFTKLNVNKQKIVDYINNGGNVFIAFHWWNYSLTSLNKSIEYYILEKCFGIILE